VHDNKTHNSARRSDQLINKFVNSLIQLHALCNNASTHLGISHLAKPLAISYSYAPGYDLSATLMQGYRCSAMMQPVPKFMTCNSLTCKDGMSNLGEIH